MKTVTLSKGGSGERTVKVSQIVIPDLWHIAHAQENAGNKAAVLECWHLAHDLKRAIEESEGGK